MSYYTVEKIISFGDTQGLTSIVPDSSASIAIQFWNGNEWVTDDKSPVTTPKQIATVNMKVKFTPTGGGFFIDEGAAL